MPVKITQHSGGDPATPDATTFWNELQAIVDLCNDLEQRVIKLEATVQLHTTQIAALKAKVGG